MFDDCLIMAGGSGTRLWPASSSRLPKQFLPAYGKTSFFSMAVERALALTKNNGNVIVIAGKSHVPHVIADTARLSAGRRKRLVVIGEPAAKNTAPAVACAVSYSLLNGAGRNMLVLTSDHIIKPPEAFRADATLAACAAAKGKLVVFGIPPARPETGYGYIETGRTVDGVSRVTAFHEKPDPRTAKKYAAGKRFFWNSGMFAFSVESMAGLFRDLAPKVILPFARLGTPSVTETDGVRVLESWPGLAAAYRKTESISFDYAIAEKCPDTVMVRAGFDWIDIGNWEEYVRIRGSGKTQVFGASGDGCHVDSDIPVALAGVEDLIVVIRSGRDGGPPVALVTRKGQTQRVREVVDMIRESGRTDLL